MNISQDDINAVILDKINKATISLKEFNSDYITKENEYAKLTHDFFKNLNDEQIETFDNIIDVMGDIQKEEVLIAYKTGVKEIASKEFTVPYYIVEEIMEYYQRGKPVTKWSNIVSLMNLAKVNHRLTDSQIQTLKDLCQ